jgi:hypothetical protein
MDITSFRAYSGFREFALKDEQQAYEIFENQQVIDIEPL